MTLDQPADPSGELAAPRRATTRIGMINSQHSCAEQRDGEGVRCVEEADGAAEFLVVALIANDLPLHVGTLVDLHRPSVKERRTYSLGSTPTAYLDLACRCWAFLDRLAAVHDYGAADNEGGS